MMMTKMMMIVIAALALSLITETTADPETQSCKRIVCYITNWAQYRPGDGLFKPENVDSSLCTHFIYAFAKVQSNRLVQYEWNDEQLYKQLADLKKKNPTIRTLLAVGGWTHGSAGFTEMVRTKASRAEFVRQSIDVLRYHKFDGLDLDWEYPANRGSPSDDRGRFTVLVKELKHAFNEESRKTGQPRLLLTAAVGAGKPVIDTAYDIPAISEHLDFINLMTYDFHGAWESVTGHNSPLYSEDTLNVDWAARYWVEKGAPKDKLVIGMTFYGRSFTLKNPSKNQVGDIAVQAGRAGPFTRTEGVLAYYEVCKLQHEGATIHRIKKQKVPYLLKGNQWVGYDDKESLKHKVDYALSYGGVMVWTLDLDDFSGKFCNQGAYPLTKAVNTYCKQGSKSGNPPEPVNDSEPDDSPAPTSTSVPEKPDDSPNPSSDPGTQHGKVTKDFCKGKPSEMYPDPNNSTYYIQCSNGHTYWMPCPPGLVFNPAIKVCDWPSHLV